MSSMWYWLGTTDVTFLLSCRHTTEREDGRDQKQYFLNIALIYSPIRYDGRDKNEIFENILMLHTTTDHDNNL